MDATSKNRLLRLYDKIETSTVTTDFYNRVYQYFNHLKKLDSFHTIIKEDEKAWTSHVRSLIQSVPKKRDNENEIDEFKKQVDHTKSGQYQFLNYYYGTINKYIIQQLDWHFINNIPTEEADIMLNGRKKKPFTLFKKKGLLPHEEIDYNKIYIDNFQNMKVIVSSFHNLLLIKLKEPATVTNVDKNTIFINDEEKCLYFLGTKIPLSLKADITDAQILLTRLFKNPKEPIYYSDEKENIVSSIFKNPYDKKKTPAKFTNAIANFNNKMTQAKQPNDLLIYTTGESGEVKINPKYLNKIKK